MVFRCYSYDNETDNWSEVIDGSGKSFFMFATSSMYSVPMKGENRSWMILAASVHGTIKSKLVKPGNYVDMIEKV